MSQRPPAPARYLRYIWLVYLGALFFQPLFDSSSDVLDWLTIPVLIALFVPVYAATFRARDDRQTLLLIGVMAALALGGSVLNSGASVFAIFAAAIAGRLHPTRRAVALVTALVGLVGVMVLISPVPMPWRLAGPFPALFFTAVVGATTIFDAERDRANKRLLRADEEIERLATIAERERIARDLHDLLGHTLSVVVLKSELAGRLLRSDPDRAAAEIEDIQHIGREALGEVRTAVAGYRARGLAAEIDGARVALEAAGVDVTVEGPADPTVLRPEQESALAMALREAVTNVVRHADARHATISITMVGTTARLRVTDDGRGATGPAGSGLTGMRERIVALGGHVEVAAASGRTSPPGHGSSPGPDPAHGTVVEVTLPLTATAEAARRTGR